MSDILGEGPIDLRVSRQNVTVRRQVVDVLRTAILESRFKPGDRLTERELCARTGASRTSVREALRHLESEGLISNLPNRGPVVASVTMEEARQIYEVWEALESLAGRLFAERASDAQIEDLNGALARLEQSVAATDRTEICAETVRLYDTILNGSGNEFIAGFIRSLHARVAFLRPVSMLHPQHVQRSLAEIQSIVAAIARRDPATAADACAHHVRQAATTALAILGSSAGS